MAIAVEDVRRPVAFDGPVAESVLEVLKGGEDLALDDWGHLFALGDRRRQTTAMGSAGRVWSTLVSFPIIQGGIGSSRSKNT